MIDLETIRHCSYSNVRELWGPRYNGTMRPPATATCSVLIDEKKKLIFKYDGRYWVPRTS